MLRSKEDLFKFALISMILAQPLRPQGDRDHAFHKFVSPLPIKLAQLF